jgi:endo-1,4-beta-xylanase
MLLSLTTRLSLLHHRSINQQLVKSVLFLSCFAGMMGSTIACSAKAVEVPSQTKNQPAQSVTQSSRKSKVLETSEQRIRQVRMGDLNVKVLDAKGQPVNDATIKIEQTKHAFLFGVALHTEIFDPENPDYLESDRENYQRIAKELFNSAVHENALKWIVNEYERGKPTYKDADRILAWTQENGLKMRGHTIYWESHEWTQAWVKALPVKEMRQVVAERAKDVCTRYRGKIDEFDVFNEALHDDFYRTTFGQQIFADMFQVCQKANPQARLFVNDYGVIEANSVPAYVKQIQEWTKRGAKVAGIGVQAHLEYQDKPTPEKVQASLDGLATLKLPIKITEFTSQAKTDEEQTQKMEDFMRVAFAHPAVESILFWGFWDGNHVHANAGLYRQDWSEKPAGKRYRELVYGQWWTNETLQSNAQGQAKTRVFYGEHTVSVKQGDRETVQTFVIKPTEKSGKTITVKLQ